MANKIEIVSVDETEGDNPKITGIVHVDGLDFKWKIRPDGSIKVAAGLGAERKQVTSFIGNFLIREGIIIVTAEIPASNLAAAQNFSAPIPLPILEEGGEQTFSGSEMKLLSTMANNVIDNSDGSFGFYDQFFPEQSSKNYVDISFSFIRFQALGYIVMNKPQFSFTEEGVNLLVKLEILTEKRAESFRAHL